MTFIDLFSGIGGFRLGMERAGHTCLGHVEIDKFANKSYKAIFGGDDLIGSDITKITTDVWREYRGKVDCICGGFPCQAFSIAGHRRGFEDTRGTLFFEILRAAKEIQPSYLFLENVKGLLSHNKGETFEIMLQALDELGYDVEWKVLNSKDFGVPQNRERVFVIGHLRGRSTRKVFSIRDASKENSTNKTTTVGKWLGTNRRTGKQVLSVNGLHTTLTTKYHENDVPKIAIPVLTPTRFKKRQKGRRFKENGEPSFTLTTQDRHGVIVQKPRGFNKGGEFEISPTLSKSSWECNNFLKQGFRIRKLTPKECWRLQGFPDWAFEKAREVNSDSQLYKQAGNSVTVNVIEWIAKRLEVKE